MAQGLKILFVGVLDVDWSTNVEMKKALLQLGHEVEDFNYRTIAKNFTPNWQKIKLFKCVEKFFSFLRRLDYLPKSIRLTYFSINGRKLMNNLLIKKVINKKYNLVLIAKGEDLNPDSISLINEYSKTWYFFMDPIEQAKRLNILSIISKTNYCSATFSDVVNFAQSNKINMYWIMQGIDKKTFFLSKIKKTTDIVFAGEKTPERYQMVIDLKGFGFNVVCYGDGWENSSIYQNELLNIYQSSKIILNFCREGRGFSVRVFQALGSGTFVLSQWCPDLLKVFERKNQLDWFFTKSEMKNKVEFYLKNEKIRDQMGIRGSKFVHRHHTWNSVMGDMLKKISFHS